MRHRAITGVSKKLGVFVALILLLLVPAARADPGFTLEGWKTWQWGDSALINSVACADVDGDAQVEIVTGGYYDDGTRDRAQLVVWDGATLTLEGVKTWYWVDDTSIRSVAVGDVDGDGSVEIVTGGTFYTFIIDVGWRRVAQLAVWDGATLSLEGVTKWYWVGSTYIRSVAVGDVDGDGSVEIVTGGYYFDGTRSNAQLAVWDGATLTLEAVKTWYWVDDTSITSVAWGDVDGDGQNEIVTGGNYWVGLRLNAQLCVWDGATLSLENVETWYWTGKTRIWSVAVGDVDGDTAVEIVTGGEYLDVRDRAQLCVWTGATLALEDVTTWYWVSGTLIQSVAVGDVDGDAQMEIITGGDYWDGTRNRAQLAVWDGATLAYEGVTDWYWTGRTWINSVAVGDVDADTAVEIVTGGMYITDTTSPYKYVAQLCVWGFT